MSFATRMLSCLVLLSLTVPALAAAKDKKKSASAELPSDPAILKTLRAAHPRLMLHDDRLAELKKLVAGDERAGRIWKEALADADECLHKPKLVHKLVGPRLLHVSRDCLRRVYALALAWRMTGKDAYADRCIQDMLTVCGFPDWNPSHFLDTAEMSHAVGIGYDWLYGRIGEKDRQTIRVALIRLGIEPGLKVYRTGGWWSKSYHNWNQVCNGGMIVAALAIADSDPQYAQQVVPAALKSLPLALGTYAPDGAWPEGPGYWGYATAYTCFGLAALESALGSDFGLGKSDGLDTSALFPLYTAGPTGLYFNYADSGEKARRRAMAWMFYLANKYGVAEAAWDEHEMLARSGGASPLHLVWYVSRPKARPAELALDKKFDGSVEIAMFRSSWEADALFAAIKAGYNQVNHSHLDLGSFELDALGQRWARDLGSDDYNLSGYWNSREGGTRWNYYRLGSLSHNVPLLDGRHQRADGRSRMTVFRCAPAQPAAVVDFSSAYPAATKALRGLALVQDRRAALVQDELVLPRPVEITWGMATDAEIRADGASAVLKLDGKELRMQILEPAGAAFEIESAEQKPPQKTNRGVRRLVCRIKNASGNVRIAILFTPAWPAGLPKGKPEIKPLGQW